MHQAHNLNKKKNGGVNSFLVTVWLSMMVGSLRSREKKNPVQQQVGLPIMALFHESRLIHTEPCLIITERKTRMVVDFCYTLYKRKYSKGLNRWMELSSFIHISYRHDGLDAHTLYVFRFLSWKERWMFTISRGMTS